MTVATMQRTKPDARFWDRISGYYSRKAVPDVEAYNTKLAKTDSYLKAEDVVLEIGCGTGTTALHHAPKVARLDATDISAKMIAIARDKAAASRSDNLHFSVSSIEELDPAPGQYDAILAHSVLHLVADVPGTLKKLHGMLKPSGVLVVNTQCIGDSAAWLGLVAPLGRMLGLLPRINVFREQALLQWIEDSGFAIEELWHPKPKASHYIVARAVEGTR